MCPLWDAYPRANRVPIDRACLARVMAGARRERAMREAMTFRRENEKREGERERRGLGRGFGWGVVRWLGLRLGRALRANDLGSAHHAACRPKHSHPLTVLTDKLVVPPPIARPLYADYTTPSPSPTALTPSHLIFGMAPRPTILLTGASKCIYHPVPTRAYAAADG